MATLVNQTAAAWSSGTTIALASVDPDAGNLVVICAQNRNGLSVTGVSGSTSGAYTQAGASSTDRAIFYFENHSGTSETVTVTFSGTPTGAAAQAAWFSGIATSSALDQNSSNVNGSGTSHTSGNITTTGAGVIICSALITGNFTKTAGASYTKLAYTPADASRWFSQYRIVTGSTITDGPFTTDSAISSYAMIASFNDAAGGGVIVTTNGLQSLNRQFGPQRSARLGGVLQ